MVARQRGVGLGLAVAGVLGQLAVTAVAVAQPFDGEQDAQPQSATLAIVGGLLIDGHEGPPLPGAVVLVDGNRIVAVGSRDQLDVPDGAEVVDATGMTVLPGLIDVHVHLDILGHSDYQHWHGRYRSRYADVMAVSARQLLMSGVTTVVDLAGQPDALSRTKARIEGGEIPGPRVVASMGWITNWPDAQVQRHHRRTHTVNVRTVDDARAAARTAIAQGAEILKVHTGLTEGQLRAIAEEGDRRGIRGGEGAVVELADAHAVVAVVFEVLGKGRNVGVEVAEVDVVALDADGIGAQSGHEAGAGGVAEGLLAVGAIEENAGGGEGVDIGGVNVRGAVAA